VEDPDKLISEITALLESKQAHPLLDQMVNPDVRDDMPIADFTAVSSGIRAFFSVQRLHGFRQVVTHIQLQTVKL